MASTKFSILVLVAVLLPSIALATQYVVGDDKGWTVDYNYTTWTAGKVFYVGDTLVFNYNKDKHNVFKVQSADAFKSCTKPDDPKLGFHSGNDVFTLATPGKKWYICGVTDHCSARQMSLVINVAEPEGPAPAPYFPPGTPTWPVAPSPGSAFATPASTWFVAAAVVAVAFAI